MEKVGEKNHKNGLYRATELLQLLRTCTHAKERRRLASRSLLPIDCLSITIVISLDKQFSSYIVVKFQMA